MNYSAMISKNMQIILVIILTFGVLFILNSNLDKIFVVERYDGTELITNESIKIQQGSAQSIFGLDGNNMLYLQSTLPVDQNEDMIIIKATVFNPFNDQTKIVSSKFSNNGKVLDNKNHFELWLGPNDKYVYKSIPFDPASTTLNMRNVLRTEFLLESKSGQQKIMAYEYVFYRLNQCQSDIDCFSPNKICDKENVARFGDGVKSYCVRSCLDNGHCLEGQVCINGRCGY